jgi:hypothetical protein
MLRATDELDESIESRPVSLRGLLRSIAPAAALIGWVHDPFWLTLLAGAAGLLLFQSVAVAICTRNLSRAIGEDNWHFDGA